MKHGTAYSSLEGCNLTKLPANLYTLCNCHMGTNILSFYYTIIIYQAAEHLKYRYLQVNI